VNRALAPLRQRAEMRRRALSCARLLLTVSRTKAAVVTAVERSERSMGCFTHPPGDIRIVMKSEKQKQSYVSECRIEFFTRLLVIQ